MTIEEFRKYMASGKPVIGGSDVHMMFHQLSQEALRITAEINGIYHTPEELHCLLEQLWGREVHKTIGMFPPEAKYELCAYSYWKECLDWSQCNSTCRSENR